jgi:predicted dehydrogenase
MKDSLGVALVGLGRYANELRSALRQTKNCHLSGIVTGTRAKATDWAGEFGISSHSIYDYTTFDRIADNPDIDIVYVVLPNSMHAEYTIRTARAGKHVICEKPMAVTVDECKAMIRACRDADCSLSIGYRLHFEPFNLEMRRLGQDQVYGKIKLIETSNGFHLQDAKEWRLRKSLAGGGALMDMGIYAIQGARYVTGEEPISVLAQEFKTDPFTFCEVEETICWQMAFPSGTVANCAATYAADIGRLFVAAERGWFELDPAYAYSDLKGWTFDGKRESMVELTGINQQAAQLDAIADAIRNRRPSPVPGEEGLQDLRIIEAIYRSVAAGQAITINYERI